MAEESINAISDASEFMQRDLEEFAKVVKEDSTAILSAATEASYQSINHYAGEEIAKETANYTKAGVSIIGSGLRTLVDGVEKVLLESDHESEDEKSDNKSEKTVLPENKSNTNLEEPIYETNPQTYLRDPMDPNFDNWKINFNKTIESRKNKLTEILIARTNVRLMYNKLVPKKANHNDFWARYLYRLELEGLVPDTDHVHAPDELELSTASTGTVLSETDKQESSSPESEPLEVVKKDEIKKIADSDEGDIDDWEKDLDLDITEEEMNKALAEVDDDWDLEDA